MFSRLCCILDWNLWKGFYKCTAAMDFLGSSSSLGLFWGSGEVFVSVSCFVLCTMYSRKCVGCTVGNCQVIGELASGPLLWWCDPTDMGRPLESKWVSPL